MEKNNIKSFRTKITLKEYLMINDNFNTTKFKLGTINYRLPIKHLTCQHSINNNVLILLGQKVDNLSTFLFQCNNTITEESIDNIILYVDVVLKEQIKDLKYIEQLSLFEDGKTGKDSNNE